MSSCSKYSASLPAEYVTRPADRARGAAEVLDEHRRGTCRTAGGGRLPRSRSSRLLDRRPDRRPRFDSAFVSRSVGLGPLPPLLVVSPVYGPAAFFSAGAAPMCQAPDRANRRPLVSRSVCHRRHWRYGVDAGPTDRRGPRLHSPRPTAFISVRRAPAAPATFSGHGEVEAASTSRPLNWCSTRSPVFRRSPDSAGRLRR